MDLIRMSGRIKYLPCDMERVRDDDNVFNVIVHNSLINSASNGKELGFSIGNIDSPMKAL